jgi:transglutaminase-like putative cysteine protease
MPDPKRRLSVRHTTTYAYDKPVTHSKHKLHLRPIHGWRQNLLDYELTVSSPVTPIEYEDVFGNRATRFEINEPYTELTITAESTVEVEDYDPFEFAKLPLSFKFPLSWMPWEQTMLAPYLRSEELADTQLEELYEYAMSFVTRNDGDLMETLFAMNLTLFREFKYVPGSTCLTTTPWEVMSAKQGVCQDFANLFITMARLLGIPARYVCGYIYTGNTSESRTRSDASHAWVQLYIPNVGWKAFDPTNGILPTLDHVKVGYGRHWRDTAPTAGTIYSPAAETMTVDVLVKDVTSPPAATPPPPVKGERHAAEDHPPDRPDVQRPDQRDRDGVAHGAAAGAGPAPAVVQPGDRA